MTITKVVSGTVRPAGLALADFGGRFIQIQHSGCLSSEIVNGTDWCQRLYHAKAAELLLYGRALGLSHSEAEDVLQETFVALMKRADEPRNPVHYCIRGFRNRALNYRRSLLRRVAREFESVRWFERSESETQHERAAMRCLQQLPSEQREVIVLKIWHEHTFEEIAELLELSPNTVAGRYRYGLQKLRACLKEQNYEKSGFIGEPASLMGAATALGET